LTSCTLSRDTVTVTSSPVIVRFHPAGDIDTAVMDTDLVNGWYTSGYSEAEATSVIPLGPSV
jgi:hypothetical protein